jgi:hypothetical protein
LAQKRTAEIFNRTGFPIQAGKIHKTESGPFGVGALFQLDSGVTLNEVKTDREMKNIKPAFHPKMTVPSEDRFHGAKSFRINSFFGIWPGVRTVVGVLIRWPA